MKTKVTELSHDDLVDIFSTALYGCDFLTCEYNREFYNSIPSDKKEGDCYEDIIADILLAGGKVTLIDYYAEGEVYKNGTLDDEENGVYTLTLNDLLDACGTEDGFALITSLLINEDGDYFTANNLLQIAIFGEIIYG